MQANRNSFDYKLGCSIDYHPPPPPPLVTPSTRRSPPAPGNIFVSDHTMHLQCPHLAVELMTDAFGAGPKA